MSNTTAMLHVRVDDRLKAEATRTLEAMGLSVSDAVRLLLHRVVAEQSFPLELKVPNSATQAAMAESEGLMSAGRTRFEDADALIKALDG